MKEIYKTPEGFEALVNTFECMSEDFSLIVCSAFRYALGRRTYIVSIVCKYIKENIGMLNPNHLDLIVREIDDANEFNRLGDACDRNEWMKLREHILVYQKKAEEFCGQNVHKNGIGGERNDENQ